MKALVISLFILYTIQSQVVIKVIPNNNKFKIKAIQDDSAAHYAMAHEEFIKSNLKVNIIAKKIVSTDPVQFKFTIARGKKALARKVYNEGSEVDVAAFIEESDIEVLKNDRFIIEATNVDVLEKNENQAYFIVRIR